MGNVLIVAIAALVTVGAPTSANASASRLKRVTVETIGETCRFVSDGRSAPLRLVGPCRLWLDRVGRPNTRKSAVGNGHLFVVVGGGDLAPGVAGRQCAADAQAVRVTSTAIRPMPFVLRNGTYCTGDRPEGAQWWVLEHDRSGRPYR